MRIRVLLSLIVPIAFVSFVGGGLALAILAIDDHPLAASKIELTTDDIARAKFLMEKYDPRNLKEREISRLNINGREVAILLGYMIDRLRRSPPLFSETNRIASKVEIRSGNAELLFTVGLPANPIGAYLNLGIRFVETKERPLIHQVTIGRILLRGRWMRPVLYCGEKLIQRLGLSQELRLALGIVKTVEFRPDELTLVYEWQSKVAHKLTEKGRSLLISDQDRESLIAYNNQIATTAGGIRTKETPLIHFLKPVFQLAQQRSAANNAPRAENRAAILALTLFVNHRSLTPFIGNTGEKAVRNPNWINTTLSGRTDLPRHFMLSAAITALSDSHFSNMVGLFKEIDDAISGSGFSFVDLLADRAGVRFAEFGTVDDRLARWVQQTMAGSVRESDFMPSISGLKEGLTQKRFKQRYRGLDSAAFRAEKEEIERRIDACPLFRVK